LKTNIPLPHYSILPRLPRQAGMPEAKKPDPNKKFYSIVGNMGFPKTKL
jgi:hypothetical protein